MPFLKATKAAAGLKAKQNYARSQVAWATTVGYPGSNYQIDWNLARAVDQGMRTNVWASRAIDAVASNAAGLPFLIRKDDPWNGEPIKEHPVLPLFNYRPNHYQDSYYFRYKLSGHLLVSKRGAFIEIIRSRGGDKVLALFLLNPDKVFPIQDSNDYISGYEIQTGYEKIYRSPDDIIWVGLPDLAKDYERFTFMEPAGLSIESNYQAKLFNRNFLLNDGRPGGILAIKDGIEDADAEVLRNRFLGAGAGGNGPAGAGRLTVLETGEHGVDFVDTATTPRDASYVEMLKTLKEETLAAFGVPESIIGNASMRTYDNAGVEMEIFWRETMLPHLNLLSRAMDILTGDNQYAAFDTSSIYILDRDKREQHKYYLEELRTGAITIDEYREKTGQTPIGDKHRYINAQLIAYDNEGNPALAPAVDPNAPAPPGTAPPGNAGPAGHPPGNLRPLPDGRRGPQKPPVQPGDSSGGAVAAALSADEAKDDQEAYIPATDVHFDEKGQVHRQDPVLVQKAWERHIAKQMQSYFLRQQRVVLEKLTGKRLVEHWNDSKALSVAEIFDRSRWDTQLEDDAKIWLASMVSDLAGETEILDPDGHAGVSAQARELLQVNASTAGLLDRAITKARSQDKDIDVLALAVRGIFASLVAHRSAEIAEAEVQKAAAQAVQADLEQSQDKNDDHNEDQ